MSTSILSILGAAYGPVEVTAKVRSLRQNQQLSVKAEDSVFGDSWPGVVKSLVVVYKYDNYAPVTVFVKEHETLTITPPPPTSATKNLVRFYETLTITPPPAPPTSATTITPPPAPPTSATKNLTRFFVEAKFDPQSLEKIQHTVTRSQAGQRTLIILGAVYGLADVTTTARSFVHDGVFDATANNATWGDSWPGNQKTLVVVYDYAGAVSMLNVMKENEQMYFIASPSLSIHGATYGPAPVTKKVVSLVRNRTLNVVANNDTFGDTWHGHTKSLTIIYQYGQERPIVAIATEGSALNIIYTLGSADYLPPSDPISLNIVGAAYGLGDVTSNVQALVLNNQLDITANNETFGDTWPGTEKSFTLVYQYGRNNPLLEVAKENDVVTVHKKVSPPYFGQVVTKDLLDTGDVTSLSASNNKFIACDTNGKLVAVKDAPDMTTSFTVEKNDDSTVCFKTNAGKYVVVGPDKFLHATGTQSQAARFDISMSTTAGLRLALSETQEYVRLHFDGQGIIVDTVDNFSLNTAFGIAFMSTTASMIMERRGIKEIAALDTLSACEIAWVSFVWQLTGGFFLALGLGPYLSLGTAQPGVLALIRSSPIAWAAVQNLVQLLQTTQGVTATISGLLATIVVLYKEDLLWDIFKIMIRAVGWYIVTIALAKILEVVLVPELEAAELLANFAAWAIVVTLAGLEVYSVCN